MAAGKRRRRQIGFGYYRRKRPFTIALVEPGLWSVSDIDTGEELGRIEQLSNLPSQPPRVRAVAITMVGKSAARHALPEGATVWTVANDIWLIAHPIKARAWHVLSWIVFLSNWIVRSTAITISAVAAVLFIYYLFGSIPALNTIKVEAQSALVRLAESLDKSKDQE